MMSSSSLSGDRGSFTVNDWCKHRRVSRSKFYKMLRERVGPRIHRVGSHIRISAEADRDWITAREAAGAA